MILIESKPTGVILSIEPSDYEEFKLNTVIDDGYNNNFNTGIRKGFVECLEHGKCDFMKIVTSDGVWYVISQWDGVRNNLMTIKE